MIKPIRRPSITMTPLTNDFAMSEATSGVGWILLWRDGQYLGDAVDQQAHDLVADLSHHDGVTGGRLR